MSFRGRRERNRLIEGECMRGKEGESGVMAKNSGGGDVEEIWAYIWKIKREKANPNKQKKRERKPHQRVVEKP